MGICGESAAYLWCLQLSSRLTHNSLHGCALSLIKHLQTHPDGRMHLKVLRKISPRLSASCCVQHRHCSLCERWERARLASPAPSQRHNTTVTFVLAFCGEGCFCALDILLACRYYDSLGCTIFPKFTGNNSAARLVVFPQR